MDYVADFLDGLSEESQARCLRHIELFEEFGFALSPPDLKKIGKSIWELRPGNIRIILGKTKNYIWAIHAIKKTSQKTPQKDLLLANKRLKELQ